MEINGLMIDCSRLMEPHPYYARLIDFMAEWGMNTLLLHFADDHGLSVALPGFKRLAGKNAFSADDIAALVSRASHAGIDIIPEVETFGHTRYITRRPEYRHLFAGEQFEEAGFNAVDPLNPETLDLMRAMIESTARLFPSRFLHVGCDEVDMKAYCAKRQLDEARTWSDYVNRIIGTVHAAGKTPMLWGDHPAKDEDIARQLRKDAWLIRWNYEPDVDDTRLRNLLDAGFTDALTAPSLACYRHRFLPSAQALENTRRMAEHAREHPTHGVINTIWCPWRYLQNAMYYGIARSADMVRLAERFDADAFHERFAAGSFGLSLDDDLDTFLSTWPTAWIDYSITAKLLDPAKAFTPEEIDRMRTTVSRADAVLSAADRIRPEKNADIWRGMVLATRATRICARCALDRKGEGQGAEAAGIAIELEAIRAEMNAEWDRTRFPDDPQKHAPFRAETSHQYVMALIAELGRQYGVE